MIRKNENRSPSRYCSNAYLPIDRTCSRKNHNTAGVALFSSGSIADKETGDIASSEVSHSITSLTSPETAPSLCDKTGGGGPSNINGCSFDSNVATDGGAIYTSAGYDMVLNSSFTRNYAGNY